VVLISLPDPVLIVSPHLDDAAVSCAALLDGDKPAHVLTVFGGAPDPPRVAWSERTMGFPDSTQTMRARHAEERRAFADTPHRLESMSLLDEDYLDGPRDPADAAALGERIARWSEEHPVGSVAIPAAAGRHRGRLRARLEAFTGPRGGVLRHEDHLFARETSMATLSSLPRLTTVLYEELPYAWGGSPDREVRLLAAAHRRRAVEVVAEIDRNKKAQRLASYTSQIGHLSEFGLRLDDPSSLPGTERYWILRPR
jgi:hypothetical protein